MGAVVGEVVAGEGEERIIDVVEEFILEEKAVSLVEKGVSLGRDDDDRGDILMTQIPSIDTLLGDIYELK